MADLPLHDMDSGVDSAVLLLHHQTHVGRDGCVTFF